jgi:DNA processing protein
MDDINYWLFLNRTPGIGPVAFAEILQRFNSPRQFLQEKPWQNTQIKLRPESVAFLQKQNFDSINADLKWQEAEQNHIITLDSAHYPSLLKEIADPPPVLYVHGDAKLLHLTQLAIVGSRNPTPSGNQNASQFSQYLAEQGMVITSGLAIGIDGIAHQGALQANGRTVAVLANSLNRVYPSKHHELAHQIAENGGALVSELSIDTPVQRHLFPRRNRIISGLSVGTLVVEAALNSGSLITAKQALDQGREVFSIPGSIHNPLAKGCHHLIRQGAKLVEKAEDILEDLNFLVIASQTPSKQTIEQQTQQVDASQEKLFACLGYDPTSIDVLANNTGLAVSELSSMLVLLELEGKVENLAGGLFVRS